jgi:hypothetical protein
LVNFQCQDDRFEIAQIETNGRSKF